MTKTQAIERAKRETDAYVLWFGYRSQLVDMKFQLPYIDYLMLQPKSSSTLTEGRIDFRTANKQLIRGVSCVFPAVRLLTRATADC